MLEPDIAKRDPQDVPAEALSVRDPLALSFEGWEPEAFAVLDRLREEPHIDQYKTERDAGRLERYIKAPFKRYRDDLVLNWVLPSRLDFEAERNVFSRLLKNDFGAGGCHHHKWMAFYRPGLKRLKDVQISHSLSPKGLTVGLYVGAYAKDLLRQAKARIGEQSGRYLDKVNALLEKGGWYFTYHYGSGEHKTAPRYTEPMDTLPGDLGRADGIAVRRRLPRAEVIHWKEEAVRWALEVVLGVWPLYRFYLGANLER